MAVRDLREAWLVRVMDAQRPVFKRAGYELPSNIKVTCGWPVGNARKIIGQVWPAAHSAGRVFEIFISPQIADSLTVAATLCHELAHVAVGLKEGHGPKFRSCAVALGLTGKMTATLPGPGFKDWALPMLDRVGAYPHARLNPENAIRAKKQTTRLLKVHCPDCDAAGDPYIVRMSATALERGAPLCPEHGEAMVAAE